MLELPKYQKLFMTGITDSSTSPGRHQPHFVNILTQNTISPRIVNIVLSSEIQLPDQDEANKNFHIKKFPYEIVDVDEKTNAELLEHFTGETSRFVQVGPQKYLFPKQYRKQAENYYNFDVRPDDVWVVTYPRSGTTWTQEMVWLLVNNLNYKAAQVPLVERFPCLEFSIRFDPVLLEKLKEKNKFSPENTELLNSLVVPGYEILEKTHGRRFVKTHLPLHLLPPNLLTSGAKVIYVARNPKSVAVSYFHLHKFYKILGFSKDFPKFWEYFQRNLVAWSPYWAHVQEGWEKRHEKNLLFMFYEEMSKDLNKSIKKIVEFLNRKYSDEEIKTLEKHLSVDSFKNNKSINLEFMAKIGVADPGESFVRKGKSGGFESYFDDELNSKADKWIQENLLKTDLRFPN